MFEEIIMPPPIGAEPKYSRVARAVESYLKINRVPANTRLPGERQLAEQFGVTCVTVHRSLNDLVRKGVVERKVGSGTYTLGNNRHVKIGIVSSEPAMISDYYIGNVLTAFHQFWQGRADLISLVRNSEQYEATVREYDLSGLMVLSLQEEFVPAIRRLRDSGFPVVTIGVTLQELADISFGTDHQRICRQAVRHLVGCGCRRIGMMSIASTKTSVLERERGYNKAMYEAGLPVDPDWIIRKPALTSALTGELLRDVLEHENRPDAFLIASHCDFVPFCNLIHQFGLRIPEDIAVIGFDDPEYARHLSPPLTVFVQPIPEFTTQAARMLEEMIFHRPITPKTNCEAVLIERESCPPQKIA